MNEEMNKWFSPVYITNWKRVKLVLGCLVMEERHTGDKLAEFVENVCEAWSIRSKVDYICVNTVQGFNNYM